MFGIDKDAIKQCFADFTTETAALAPSSDPVVQAIVKFILNLSKAFN